MCGIHKREEIICMKKIAVIGSINMDLTCQAERHSGKGETISGRNLQYIPGGKGANQAVAAALLGGNVTMFGCVGDDAFADQLVDNLARNGVDTTYIRKVSGVSSGIAMITVAQNDNSIVVIPGANGCVSLEYLEAVKAVFLMADIIILQNEIPQETVLAVIDMAYAAGKTVIYNPAPVVPLEERVMDKINYLTPNEHEAALLFHEGNDLVTLLESQNGKLIVTLGEEGAAAWENGRVLRIPARSAAVVDTTGAGDTFNGAFAYALANDYPLEKALRFANVAASLSTEGFGAQGGMPDLETVLKNLKEF